MGRLLKPPFLRSQLSLKRFTEVSMETFFQVFSNSKCLVLVVVKCLYFFSVWLERALWFYFRQHERSIFGCLDSFKNKHSHFHDSFPPFSVFLTYLSWSGQSFKITDECSSCSLAGPRPALTVMLLLTSTG